MNNDSRDWVLAQLNINTINNITDFRSDENNQVYKLTTDKGDYILKNGPDLAAERDKLKWLKGKLPIPEVVGWRACDNNREELLMVAAEGEDLAKLSKTLPTESLVRLLADTLHRIHVLNISDCPFGEKQEGYVFIHGDACLPNFIFKNGQLTAVIDVGQAKIDSREVDLAAAVWSLAYNCGPGIGLEFLHTYGMTDATEADELRLITQYEPTWSGY